MPFALASAATLRLAVKPGFRRNGKELRMAKCEAVKIIFGDFERFCHVRRWG